MYRGEEFTPEAKQNRLKGETGEKTSTPRKGGGLGRDPKGVPVPGG